MLLNDIVQWKNCLHATKGIHDLDSYNADKRLTSPKWWYDPSNGQYSSDYAVLSDSCDQSQPIMYNYFNYVQLFQLCVLFPR